MKVFISAASAEFRKCREMIASDLRAGGTEVKVQEDFRLEGGTLLEKLEAYIASCERVIVIIGDAYGAEPTELEAPAGRPRRSYTQWEYFFACGERIKGGPAARKHVMVYMATPALLAERAAAQGEEHAALQRRFKEEVIASGADRHEFSNDTELCRLVLRDMGCRQDAGGIKPCNLPYKSIGSLFKGRDGYLKQLHERVLKGFTGEERAKTVAITQSTQQAICGLGGVGKTRLAIEYALRYAEDYSALLFVVADSPEHLRQGVANLAVEIDYQSNKELDEQSKFATAMRWLLEHPNWCLILDNVDDEDAARACQEFVSRLYGGHVIITSRLSRWSRSIERLDLELLDDASAAALVLERTPDRFKTDDDEQATRELVGLLDGLALGLEQAGAFINTTQCSIPEYVALWKSGQTEVQEWFDPLLMEYPRSVALTWQATIQRMGPAAKAVLELLCCLAGAPVPARMFTSPAVQDTANKFLAGTAGVGAKSMRLLLAQLASFSMIRMVNDASEPCVSVHRVVREITWQRIAAADRPLLLQTAAKLLVGCTPHEADRYENWAAWSGVLPHAQRLWEELSKLPRENWNILLVHGLALHHLGQGRKKQGRELQEHAYSLMCDRLGKHHPDTLEALNDLALLLEDDEEEMRLLREAEDGLKEAYRLDKRERTKILLLATQYNIGMALPWVGEAGAEAERILKRCVEEFACSSEAGPRHWRTLLTQRILARVLWEQGQREDAIVLAARTLESYLAAPEFGEQHKDALESMAQVALFRLAEGRFDDAVALLRRQLAGCEKAGSLGPGHKSTLRCMQSLVQVLWNLSKRREAEEVVRGCWERWPAAIGSEHPHVLVCGKILARVLAEEGKLEESRRAEVAVTLAAAKKEYMDLQSSRTASEADMMTALMVYAGALRDTHEHTEAARMYRRLINGLRESGEAMATTLAMALNNYGLLLRDMGDLENSLAAYREALAVDERARQADPAHPKIPHRLNNLSMILLMLGQTQEAKGHLKRAFALKRGREDVTSARIVWVRLAAAMLTGESCDVYLGQLKTLLARREASLAAEVDDFWEVRSVVEHMRKSLPAEDAALLACAVNEINARAHFAVGGREGGDGGGSKRLRDLPRWAEVKGVDTQVEWE